jgi:CheY-like chemotaxis protein
MQVDRFGGNRVDLLLHGDEAKARASGCDDFLTKPIDEALLFQMLNRYLGTNVT